MYLCGNLLWSERYWLFYKIIYEKSFIVFMLLKEFVNLFLSSGYWFKVYIVCIYYICDINFGLLVVDNVCI